MARRIRSIQTSFVAGELSPTAKGRVDLEQYFNGAEELDNCYPTPQGGAKRREGLQYIANTQTNQAARLVDFSFSTTQDYLLVFTPGRMDVYKDDVWQVAVTSSPISSLTATQIDEMTFTQSADVLYLFHEDVQPIEITRTGHTSWTAASVTFDYIPQYAFGSVSQASKSSTLTLTAQPDAKTYQAVSSASDFSAGSVGQTIIADFGVFVITAYTSGTTVTIVEVSAPSGYGPYTNWILETGYEDVWSGSRGWPACGTFFQGRLALGGGSRPQTIWMSQVGEFLDFFPGSGLDADAIDRTIDDDEVNSILHLVAGRNLQIFTTGGEFYIRGGSLDAPLTPSNIEIKRATSHGSSSCNPVSIDGSSLFTENGGAVIRQFIFEETEQSYTAADISRLSAHLIGNPVRAAARPATSGFQSPYTYYVNTDGTVTVLGRLRQENFLAFAPFTTDGTFEDVTVVGSDVYFVVQRTINSATVRFIEKLNPDHYLDASKRVDNGSPTTSWSGFSHLNGESVRVRADDFIFPNETPSGGAFTTDDSATILEAGVYFASKITPLPFDVAVDGQSVTGEYRRLVAVNVLLKDSRNIIAQRTKQDGSVKTYRPAFRQFGPDVLDAPVSNFSGWKKIYIGGIDRDPQVTITQEDALEFEVLAIVYELGV